MDNKNRIVITGIGPISSLGIGKDENWSNALEGNSNIVEETFLVDGEVLDKYYLHKIRNFNLKNFNIDKNSLQKINEWKADENEVMDLSYFLATIKLAIDDSRLEHAFGNDVGLVLSAESPGYGEFYMKFLETSYDFFMKKTKNKLKTNKKDFKKSYYEDFYRKFYKVGYDLQTFMTLFHVARTFNIHGYSLQINNACASGLFALETAADIIRSGKCSTVIVSAVDHPDVFKAMWFKDMGIVPSDGKIKPFSRKRDGFIMGEGGAAFVLETLEKAKKRKAKIYAEYLGGAFNLESWKVTVPHPPSHDNYYKEAIVNCIKKAKVKITDIDLIVPHATGTFVNDKLEACSINDIFCSAKNLPLITAFKPYVGHNLGGSTLLETALLLSCMENKVVLPVMHSDFENYGFKLNYARKKQSKEIEIALKTCSAFAGYNAASIFREV